MFKLDTLPQLNSEQKLLTWKVAVGKRLNNRKDLGRLVSVPHDPHGPSRARAGVWLNERSSPLKIWIQTKRSNIYNILLVYASFFFMQRFGKPHSLCMREPALKCLGVWKIDTVNIARSILRLGEVLARGLCRPNDQSSRVCQGCQGLNMMAWCQKFTSLGYWISR